MWILYFICICGEKLMPSSSCITSIHLLSTALLSRNCAQALASFCSECSAVPPLGGEEMDDGNGCHAPTQWGAEIRWSVITDTQVSCVRKEHSHHCRITLRNLKPPCPRWHVKCALTTAWSIRTSAHQRPATDAHDALAQVHSLRWLES